MTFATQAPATTHSQKGQCDVSPAQMLHGSDRALAGVALASDALATPIRQLAEWLGTVPTLI